MHDGDSKKMNLKQMLQRTLKGTLDLKKENKSSPIIGLHSSKANFEEEFIRKISANIDIHDLVIDKSSIDFNINYIECGRADNIEWKSSNKSISAFHSGINILNKNNNLISSIIEIEYFNGYEKDLSDTFFRNGRYKFFYDDILSPFKYLSKSVYPKDIVDVDAKPIFLVHNDTSDDDIYFTFFHEGKIWHDIIRLLSINEQCNSMLSKNPSFFLVGSLQVLDNKPTVDIFETRIRKLIDLFNKKPLKAYSMSEDGTIQSFTTDSSFSYDLCCISSEENIECLGYVIEIIPC